MRIPEIPSPCFVLNEAELEQNLKLIDRVQKRAGVEIILAFKGFAMWSTFPIVRKYLKSATASSLNEVKLCAQYMRAPAHTYCVAYRKEEMSEIISNSRHLTFNSLSQWETYKDEVASSGISCGLRVNPEYSDVTTDLYNPASPNSRLGMTKESFGDELPEGIEGLHFHVLCESDSYALEKVLASFEEKFGALIHKVKWVNMGGGHLMTREGYDIEHLIKVLKIFKEKYKVEVFLEPGSAIAWKTGVLRTSVLDIVENGGVKTAIIDASFTCHMPDCLEMPYRPSIVDGYEDASKGAYRYRLGGVSCLAGDYLEEYSFDQPLEIGDDLIFEDMMHYTMVKTSTFNGVQHPAIGLWNKQNEFELIREFSYTDFAQRLS